MRSQKNALTFAVVFAAALAAGSANAQHAKPGSVGDKSNSQFQLHHDDPGGADAVLARQRARAGDCAGALPAFDAATKLTIDPTVRRDRGLCFEQVGDAFPAIEDYRYYLTARPEAPDADQIRDRLQKLEDATNEERSTVAPTGKLEMGSGTENYGGTSHYTGAAPEVAERHAENIGPKPGDPPRSYDYYEAKEKEADEADHLSLRRGTGPVIGVFAHIPRFFIGQGSNNDLAYGVGVALRYATSSTLSLAGEIGFSGIGTAGDNTAQSGPMFYFGPELRFALNPLASDQLVLGAGLEFDRPVVSGTRVASDYFVARFRGGFRHVFGPQLGFEALLDAGPAFIAPEDNGDTRINVLVGGSFALVIGF